MRRRILAGVLIALVLGAATTVVVSAVLSRRTINRSYPAWNARRERVGDEGAGFVSVMQSRKPGVWWSQSQAVHIDWAGGSLRPYAKYGPLESLPSRDIRPLLLPWIYGGRPWPDAISGHTIAVLAYGWPRPALATVLEYDGRGGETWKHLFRLGPPRISRFDPQGAPTRILPIGFTINTLAAAALWHLALFTPLLLRRHCRRRRGRCLRCGYDLRASAVERCPECGEQAAGVLGAARHVAPSEI